MKPSEVLQKHLEAGVISLRAVQNAQTKKWTIKRNTLAGGWKNYELYDYDSKEAVHDAIINIIRQSKSYRQDLGQTEYMPHDRKLALENINEL